MWGRGGEGEGCLTYVSVHIRPRDAPNYGSRVPVDTTPGPAPVCRALKKSTHHGRCGITATSTTVDELREDIDHGICRCTQRACNDTCTTDVDHLVNVLQLENLNDHGNLPVRNDRLRKASKTDAEHVSAVEPRRVLNTKIPGVISRK